MTNPIEPMTPATRRIASCRRGVAWTVASGFIAMAFSLATATAQAAKTLDIRDGDTVIAVVSARDQTRIRVDRGRIIEVFGDVYEPTKNPGGRLLLRDEGNGEVFIKFVPQSVPAPAIAGAPPVPGQPSGSTAKDDDSTAVPSSPAAAAASASVGGPLKVDVKTTRGTVGLLLHPASVVGDTLVLQVSGGTAKPVADTRSGSGKSNAHVRAIKALTLAMAVPEYANEATSRPVVGRAPGGGEDVALWKEARFTLKTRHEAPGLIGESYVLTNVSDSRMVIDERELYREGVLSVAVRQLALAPGETTPVWIVRAATERD